MYKILSESRGKKQRKNYITELIKEEGEKITSYVEIMKEVELFYKKLFSRDGIKQECVDKVLNTVDARLSEEDRKMCDGDISIEEIEVAIKQTKPNKSPGSDGLTHEFYKTFVNFSTNNAEAL